MVSDDIITPISKDTDVCEVKFTPDVDIENPFFYYRLVNVYANHRQFVRSKDYA